MNRKSMLLFITTVVTGLIAGLFYCWSISVTRGLALLPDREYLSTFQQLNRAILNPFFLIGFMGLVFLLPITTWTHYQRPPSSAFWLLLSATLLYLVGVIGITMLGNVPMNEALDSFNIDAATPAGITAKRLAFEAHWNFLNNIRTICCIASFLLTLLAYSSGIIVFNEL
ncbi:anthrone oxygenase family protein [Puia dinghuensis]|uniref:Membrane protein n=1 Tax=Puia dinghuensis TaxID=1792502 RepID=A0A8J2UDM9_9BACT|nr:anthrone oxygenase family protein [Puia dinghuensis]GGB03287.1 membrane protein [Puia dinghuensis]